jgi:hypothetical protein
MLDVFSLLGPGLKGASEKGQKMWGPAAFLPARRGIYNSPIIRDAVESLLSCLAVSYFFDEGCAGIFLFCCCKKGNGDLNPNLILTYLRVIKCELDKFILPKNLGRFVQTSTYRTCCRKTKIVF